MVVQRTWAHALIVFPCNKVKTRSGYKLFQPFPMPVTPFSSSLFLTGQTISHNSNSSRNPGQVLLKNRKLFPSDMPARFFSRVSPLILCVMLLLIFYLLLLKWKLIKCWYYPIKNVVYWTFFINVRKWFYYF